MDALSPLRIRLLQGSDPDLALALALRRRVFIEEQAVPEAEEVDGRDPQCSHILVEQGPEGGREVIGCARLRDLDGASAKAERVAVRAGLRGAGVGRRLMRALEGEARRWGKAQVELGAQLEALPFYGRLGYVADGPVFMDAGIPHRHMHVDLAAAPLGGDPVLVERHLGVAWEVRPAEDRGQAALLLLPSIFGADAGTMELARSFAETGTWVRVPELFPAAPGPRAVAGQALQQALARMAAFDRNEGLERIVGQAAALGEGGRPVGSLGICFGGHLAVLAAEAAGLAFAAAAHGGGFGRMLDRLSTLSLPLSLHFGAEDPSIPPDEVAAVRAALVGNPRARVLLHPGAAHGFAHPGHPAFQAAASAAVRAAVRSLLHQAAASAASKALPSPSAQRA